MDEIRVLLAEDGLVNQIFTQEVLEQMGCHVRIVSNGMEALNAVEHNNFNLILMDCRMPVMDGFTATRLIRDIASSNERSSIPIIALTANAMEGDEQDCLQAGMNDYLIKPFTAAQLREKINYWLHMGSDDEPVLDIAAASETMDVLKGRYNELLDNFIHDVTNAIHEMQTAMQDDDIKAFIRPSHTVKSTARLMGALKLSAIATDIEKTASSVADGESPFFLRHRLWHLISTFDRTRDALSHNCRVHTDTFFPQKNIPPSTTQIS